MEVNIRNEWADASADFLALIGQQIRLQLLAVMAVQEACVCHFEAVLGLRQAVISQHLMLLRRGGLVVPRRDGRNVFYRLQKPQLVDLLYHAVTSSGGTSHDLEQLSRRPVEGCPCPQCNPNLPEFSCQGMHPLNPTSKKNIGGKNG